MTSISVFSRHYVVVLKRIRTGSVEVISHRGELFVVLGMNQVLALVADQNVGRGTAAGILTPTARRCSPFAERALDNR